jgi:hypothetical protein
MTYRMSAFSLLVLMVTTPSLAQAPSSPPASNSTAPPSQSPTPSDTAPASSSASASPAAAPAPTSSSTAAASPSDPSPELIKKARSEGFKPEKQKSGETLFCYKDASLGTKFETKKCIKQDELQIVIDARQDQRNQISSKARTCTGAGCQS